MMICDELIEDEESCKEYAETSDGDHYPWRGSTWVDGYCMRLMRDSKSAQPCSEGSQNRCHQFVATQENYDNLEQKYGFSMYVCSLPSCLRYEIVPTDTMPRYEYYKLALDWKKNGGADRKPDLWALPEDGSFPLW